MKKNVRWLAVIFLSLSAVANLSAQSGSSHYFAQGNAAYRNAEYQSALEWYRKIIADGYESSALHYNIGNTYYKLNNIGGAILHYEKALKLNPGDRELKTNLEIANLKVSDRIEMPPRFILFQWWDSLIALFTLSGWTYLMIGFYILTIGLLTALLFVGRRRWRRTILLSLTISIFAVLLSTYILYERVQQDLRQPAAIVLSSYVNVLSAPDENSTDVFVLHEGAKVTLAERRGDWIRIRLADGKSGWMRLENVGII